MPNNFIANIQQAISRYKFN